MNCVLQHYGENAVITFDGYPSESNLKTIKSAEKTCHLRLYDSVEILFESVFPQVKGKLLENENNNYILFLYFYVNFSK